MFPHIPYHFSRHLQQERIKEAEQYRLAMRARGGRPSLIATVVERVGEVLVKFGTKLQRRDAPQPSGAVQWAEK